MPVIYFTSITGIAEIIAKTFKENFQILYLGTT